MTTAERDVRAFCAEFDTPNTRALLAHCEAGRCSWHHAAQIAELSLRSALAEIRG